MKTANVFKEFCIEAGLFLLGTLSVSFFYENTFFLTFLLIFYWITAAILWHSKYDMYFSFAGAFMGPVAEIIHIHYGVWHYEISQFMGIPIWLPFGWGLMTLLIKRTAETLAKIK